MNDENIKPLGGYFELEMPAGVLPHQGATRFQSARAAFLTLLRSGMPARVWMPRFLCDAMYRPLQVTGIEPLCYDLDDQLDVDERVELKSGDWLLYVNYFGLCGHNVTKLKQRFSPHQIVLDFSQAFLEAADDEFLATIYSPRKYFGVPDGGMLFSRIPIQMPKDRYTKSMDHMSYLLKRLACSPEVGYLDYQNAEKCLMDCEPKRMSKLTERILASVNIDLARKRRRENFLFLHDKLGSRNQIAIDLNDEAVPLCYPFQTDEPKLRQRLVRSRIFVPTYWSDAIGRVGEEWAAKMIWRLMPLPIDQRYDVGDMRRIVSVIREAMV